MGILTTTLLAIGTVIAAVAIGANIFLPQELNINRSITVQGSKADVFDVFASAERFQEINPFKDEDPNLKITLDGPESGVGSKFFFDGKGSKGSHTILSMVDGESITAEIDNGPHGISTTVYRFTETSEGVKVEWNMNADFGYNPIGRIVGTFLEKELGPIFERGLVNAGRVVAA